MRRRPLGFDRALLKRQVSKPTGFLDSGSLELGGDRLAQDARVLKLAENVLKRLHLFHESAGLGGFGRDGLEEVAEPLGGDARPMERFTVLRRRHGVEAFLQPGGALRDEAPGGRKKALFVIEAEPRAREGFSERLPEGAELPAKGGRTRRFVRETV